MEESESRSVAVMHALITTVRLMHRLRESKLAQHPELAGLSGPRMGLLFQVAHAGSIRMGDLAARLMVAPRTVTDMVDGLERDGYIARTPDPKDRRAFRLELTPEVKARFHRFAGVRDRVLDEIFSVLTEAEKDQLVALLTKLQEGPLRELAQGGGCPG